MIEIKTGTLHEKIIRILQKTYPVTIADLQKKLRVSRTILRRDLLKLQTKGILRLEPLPDKTFIRLLRHDFSFIGKRRGQRKFIKHSKRKKQPPKDYDGMMYS